MEYSAQYWIEQLHLIPHPEGGYFREVYRSPERIARQHLPARYTGDHSFMTSIYFLIFGNRPALLHRVQSDELWAFLDGSPLTIHTFHPDGSYKPVILGKDIPSGQMPQFTVPAGTWFGETGLDPQGFSLVACVVAPGFEYADFELASRKKLVEMYPGMAEIISLLTMPDEEGQ